VSELWKNIGFTSGARIYSLATGAVGLIITARALGPDGRGAVAASVTWALLFSTFGYLSLGQVAIHRGMQRPPSEWLGPVLGALIAMLGLVTVVGWIVAFVLFVATDGRAYGDVPTYALVLGFATLPFLVWEQYGSALLSGVGRVNVYNRAEITGRTVGLLLVAVLVVLAGAGIAGALVALIVGQAIVAGAGVRYLLRRAGSSVTFSPRVLREMVAGGLKLHMTAVGGFLYTSASILIVQGIGTSADTGSFQVVAQLMNFALIVPQAAAMVLYGEVARDGPDRAWSTNRRVLLRLAPLMLATAIVGALAAPTVLPLLLGNEFSAAVPIFQILVFALFGQAFSTIMAPQWIARGLFWQASAITVFFGVCNVIACFPLVHAFGPEGAAWSLLGVSLISVVSNGAMALWVSRKAARAGTPEEPLVGEPA
jgi:O-antigen/teichoic acid export membrane protein